MLQNSRVTAFTVCELLRENQEGVGGVGGGGGGSGVKIPPPRLGWINELRQESSKPIANFYMIFPHFMRTLCQN